MILDKYQISHGEQIQNRGYSAIAKVTNENGYVFLQNGLKE